MKSYAFIGNWKMNKTRAETKILAKELKAIFKNYKSALIAIAPPFTSLIDAGKEIKNSNIKLCAQNCHWKESGAWTGEISPIMLKELNVEFVILGHSERRQYFGETDEGVNMRARAAVEHGLVPVVCVGESREQRENNETLNIIKRQVTQSLKDLSLRNSEQMILAYEPVWAIGTGLVAKPEQIEEVHRFIRALLINIFGEVGKKIKILYGGSVKPENINSFISIEDVNGALVGGASLNAKEFFSIAKSINK
jgi:triosephosphate isomerase